MGLAVLLVVLSMCVPSYGNFFLIYNVSTTVKGADSATDAKATVALKGYLVLNLTDANGYVVDANLIMYGNDANTPKKQKVYVQLNYSDSADYLSADVWYIGDLMFVDFWGDSPWDFEIMLQGKASYKDVGWGTGPGDEAWAASSIKGVNMVWDKFLLGPNGDQDVSGTATASASLDLKTTKLVNKNGWTQENIVETGGTIAGKHQNSLIEILTAKHYNPAVLPTH
jgi:hypothetical protein